MPIEFQPGQIYESETGTRIIITAVDGDMISFVATDGAFTKNNIADDVVTSMFPKYCGESTVSYQ